MGFFNSIIIQQRRWLCIQVFAVHQSLRQEVESISIPRRRMNVRWARALQRSQDRNNRASWCGVRGTPLLMTASTGLLQSSSKIQACFIVLLLLSLPLVSQSVCGDAAVAEGEQCDDGNVLPGDGCSSECAIECGWKCEVSCYFSD